MELVAGVSGDELQAAVLALGHAGRDVSHGVANMVHLVDTGGDYGRVAGLDQLHLHLAEVDEGVAATAPGGAAANMGAREALHIPVDGGLEVPDQVAGSGRCVPHPVLRCRLRTQRAPTGSDALVCRWWSRRRGRRPDGRRRLRKARRCPKAKPRARRSSAACSHVFNDVADMVHVPAPCCRRRTCPRAR